MLTPPATIPDATATLIISSLNRATGDDLGFSDAVRDLRGILPTLWSLYADKGQFSARLQYLYVQRAALDFLRARIVDAVSFTEAGVQQSDSDVFKAMSDLRDDIDADILALEAQVRAGQQPAMAAMTTVQIGPVPAYGVNPADTQYLGDPLKPPFLVIR